MPTPACPSTMSSAPSPPRTCATSAAIRPSSLSRSRRSALPGAPTETVRSALSQEATRVPQAGHRTGRGAACRARVGGLEQNAGAGRRATTAARGWRSSPWPAADQRRRFDVPPCPDHRAATARDHDALARLSAGDARWHLGGLALLTEANGAVVAAIGLTSGTVLADPIDPNAGAIRSLGRAATGSSGKAATSERRGLAPTDRLFSRQHRDDLGGLRTTAVTDTPQSATAWTPEAVRDAGSDQGAAGAGEGPVPR